VSRTAVSGKGRAAPSTGGRSAFAKPEVASQADPLARIWRNSDLDVLM
jgi:hypothetical protein